MVTLTTTFPHFFLNTKTSISPVLSLSLRYARRKFHFYPRNRIVACRAMMDSPEEHQQGLSTSLLNSVTQDFKNHTLQFHHTNKLNLEDLNWDNSFVRELPSDPRTDPLPREVATISFLQFNLLERKLGFELGFCLQFQVLHACYTKVSPSVQVDDPQLVVWSESVADLLELDHKE